MSARLRRQVAEPPGGGQAEPHGLAPMPGSAPHIGVVGYTLGGGLSPVFGRSKGYAADHVVSIDVVTADGELRTATADDDPDLFWALRGCKGNFGVVTAIEIELFPVAHVYVGGLYFPGERSAEILHAWRTSSGSTTMSARWNQDSETSAPPGWLPGGADMGLPGYVVATCS